MKLNRKRQFRATYLYNLSNSYSRNSLKLKNNFSWIDWSGIIFYSTFTRTYPCFGCTYRNNFIWKNTNPKFSTSSNVSIQNTSSSFNLSRGNKKKIDRLKSIFAKRYQISTVRFSKKSTTL